MCIALIVLLGAPACSGVADNSELGDPLDLVFGEVRLATSEVEDEFTVLKQDFIDSEQRFTACVRGLGFDYTPRSIDVVLPASEYLPTVVELRRQHGYGIVDGEGNTGVVVNMTGGTVPAEQRDDFSSLVLAEDEGGCLGFYYQNDIQEQLFGLRLADTSPSERVLADPRFAEAQEAWGLCMRQRGFAYSNRFDPFDDIENRLGELDADSEDFENELAELAAEEIRTASADMECHLREIEPVVQALSEAPE